MEYLKMKRVLSYAVLWSLFILLVGNVQADGTGTLSFLSKDTGNFDIYLVDTQGKIRHHLSTGLADMSALTWSPDGRFIAYVSNTGGNAEIYVMNVGNRKTRRLTDHLSTDTSPAWSPDGKWIAFTSNRMGNNDIYKVEVTGAKLERLTHQGDNKSPVWSPDSQWIAFVSSRNEKGGLYIMTANGNRLKRLADASFMWGGCTWSPNGTQIAFSAWDPEVEGINIFIVDADGKNKHHLTREEPRDLLFDPKVPLAYRPTWSPDGHCLAYTLEYLRVPKPEGLEKNKKIIFPLVPRDGVICITNAVAGGSGKPLLIAEGLSSDLSPVWVPADFFPVSPQPQLLSIQWGQLKK